MSELIAIDVNASLPSIEVNYEKLKETANAELEKFQGMVVTADSVKESKALAAELNKVAKQIDDTRKQYKKELGAPIAEFEQKMNELRDLYKKTYQQITEQTKAFEDERKQKASELIGEFLTKMYEDNDVREPFQKAQVNNLATLGALTAKGALTKKTKDGITSEVNKCLAWQAKIDKRLSDLEALSYKSGLTEPLQQHHVQGFLFNEDDDAYNQQLVDLIANEVERHSRIVEQAKQQAEVRQQAEAQKISITDTDGSVLVFNSGDEARSHANCMGLDIKRGDDGGYFFVNIEQPEPEPEPNPVPDRQPSGYEAVDTHTEQAPEEGNVSVMVNCLFRIEVPAVITDGQIEAKFKSMLQKAGFTSLDSIGIVRK